MCVGGYFMQVNLIVGYEMKIDTHIWKYTYCVVQNKLDHLACLACKVKKFSLAKCNVNRNSIPIILHILFSNKYVF